MWWLRRAGAWERAASSNSSGGYRYLGAAASSRDGRGGWLVSGGFPYGDTTEVWRAGQWSWGPDLGHYLANHCQVLLDNTVYIVGGDTVRDYTGTDQ